MPLGLRPTAHLLARLSAGLAGATALALMAAGLAPAAATAAGPDPALAKKLTKVMRDSRVLRARSASMVMDASNGAEIYARFGSRGTTPASNTKILTAVAAMKNLGPGYRFRTDVVRRAPVRNGLVLGGLYLKGYGDPTTMVSDFRSLASKVRASGIRRVGTNLVVDASFFDANRYNVGWAPGYASDYYAAQISALTVAPNADLDSGTVFVSFRGGLKGKRARVSVGSSTVRGFFHVVNKTVTTTAGFSTFSAHRTLGTNIITVRGRVRLGRATSSRLITVNRPDLYAGAVFRAELARAGVTVAGATRVGILPRTLRHLVARDSSMTLAHLLVPFLKLSNNMHAEALTKAMGTKTHRPGSWANGLPYTRAYMQSLGAPMAGVRLVDGSGLTRLNTITPRAMGMVLFKVQRETWFPAFYRALPIAGNRVRMTGGTLRNRMNGTRAANNAHAKTGSLTGVTALSGYVSGADGRPYIFSMLSQYRGATPRPVENTLVITLANWRRPTVSPLATAVPRP